MFSHVSVWLLGHCSSLFAVGTHPTAMLSNSYNRFLFRVSFQLVYLAQLVQLIGSNSRKALLLEFKFKAGI